MYMSDAIASQCSSGSVRRRFPPWLKKRLPAGGASSEVRWALSELSLHTVCLSAHCPNLCECFARGTATFMILGDVCTRNCRFCAVAGGAPAVERPDPDEPARIAEAAARLGLTHVVVTSVTRDDLPDGGARQFARTIDAVRGRIDATIEVLTPDFEGRSADVDTVLTAAPDVYNHNIETVPRLYPHVRPEADFERSLGLLRHVAESGRARAKSGLMVGLGETQDEIIGVMHRLHDAGCLLLTIGQYLSPSAEHLDVAEFVTPEQFDAYTAAAERIGFTGIASGPFVRSSYHAELVVSGTSSRRVGSRTAPTLRAEWRLSDAD